MDLSMNLNPRWDGAPSLVGAHVGLMAMDASDSQFIGNFSGDMADGNQLTTFYTESMEINNVGDMDRDLMAGFTTNVQDSMAFLTIYGSQQWCSSQLATPGALVETEALVANVFGMPEVISDSLGTEMFCSDCRWDVLGDSPGNEIPVQSTDGIPGALDGSPEPRCLSSLQMECISLIIPNIQLREGIQKDLKGRKSSTDVSPSTSGGLSVLRIAESQEYLGILGQETAVYLSSLVSDYGTTLSATLTTGGRELQVVVYGLDSKRDAIGDMLYDHNAHLQPPDHRGYKAPYRNPQLLFIPGEEEGGDGEIEGWDDTLDGCTSKAAAVLNAVEKSKVFELIDSASGPTTFIKVELSDALLTELKPHQETALSFMVEKEAGMLDGTQFHPMWTQGDLRPGSEQAIYYNNITGTQTTREPRQCLGGILADDMGLGKTLTTLALIAGTVRTVDGGTLDWHFKQGSVRYHIFHGPNRHQSIACAKSADVVFTTYETLRIEAPDARKQVRADAPLNTHTIQNRSSQSFQAVSALKARHRWCLTGTPVMNCLEDFGSLVEFLKVDPFGNPRKFKATLVQAICLRRTKAILKDVIGVPERQQIVCDVYLAAEERTVYDLVHEHFLRLTKSGANTFNLLLRLRQICTHGTELLPLDLRAWLEKASLFSDHPDPSLFGGTGESRPFYGTSKRIAEPVLRASLGSAAVGQAFDRVYRLGQTSEVIITRYILIGKDGASDSIEQYITKNQQSKMALISASVEAYSGNGCKRSVILSSCGQVQDE
ncbi:hypothetical protein QBC35DRAFT_475406 [Podospora australis]|uniref:Helicase ATP-binding domain-containing protein n=1 Tax=Podospora australis TaxID=1536484 RepID=A0AAN6WR84_9PEZI|nr:hypothetical protein QBC35DRAFT_475406 [Podospora australis]